MNATIIYYNGFPSPIGELHFSIEFGIMDEWIRYVSVPYRGATFLNWLDDLVDNLPHEFPSPIGELHFSITPKYATRIQRPQSFRPLSGSYISQYVTVVFAQMERESFRPLSGSYISQFR